MSDDNIYKYFKTAELNIKNYDIKNIKEKKEKEKVDPIEVEKYIIKNKKYFPENRIMYLKNRLLECEKKSFELVIITKLISPIKIKVISFFIGWLGVDRFMVHSIALGILKLLSLGLLGILWIYDIFTIDRKVKFMNFEKVIMRVFS